MGKYIFPDSWIAEIFKCTIILELNTFLFNQFERSDKGVLEYTFEDTPSKLLCRLQYIKMEAETHR